MSLETEVAGTINPRLQKCRHHHGAARATHPIISLCSGVAQVRTKLLLRDGVALLIMEM